MQEIIKRFDDWWRHKKTDNPLVRLISKKTEYDKSKIVDVGDMRKTPFDFHLSSEYRVQEMRNIMVTHNFHIDAFPYVDLNLGPGSMAAYLKCEPGFSYDTIWYNEAKYNKLEDLYAISYENSTHWWHDHVEIIKKAVMLSRGEFPICIPDIQENLDIVSAICGAQNLCFDLIDYPDEVKKIQSIVDDCFYKYYDDMYNLTKDENGDSAFTAFSIWGRGKTAKLQCDFSALISPDIFNEYVLPSLEKQCDYLDNTMYHLDGVMAVRHLQSILSLKKLDALQWTPGAGEEDGGSEKWYNIYDKAMDAGKSLWIQIYDGDCDSWIKKSKKILKRYGASGIYFVYGETSENDANKIISEIMR